jgi:hypothetical protein
VLLYTAVTDRSLLCTAAATAASALQGTVAGAWSPHDEQNDNRGIAGVVGPTYGNMVRWVVVAYQMLLYLVITAKTCELAA